MGHQLGSKEISEMIDDISNGNLKLVIETEYSFENAPEAFSKAETRHARGKSEVTL
jgi:NADPH:quinone reductase-like Zn-dependent oxidoreductase